MNVRQFLNKKQKDEILEAIITAEKMTSGEIRLHLESKCKIDTLERAMEVFQQLKMHETRLHNGVLIYIAISDKKLAIFGDKGINEVVSNDFWEIIKEEMLEHFHNGSFSKGIVICINKIGEKLKEYFPYQDDDINELPNDISINER
jgi:uncharacterized membrane protein